MCNTTFNNLTDIEISKIVNLKIIETVFFVLAIHSMVVHCSLLAILLVKLTRVTDYIRHKNPIFSIYFVSLFLGLSLNIICNALVINYRQDIPGHITILNFFVTFGSIFNDAFLTLVPNFYFSLIRSKLNLVRSAATKRFFIVNLSVTGVFIVFVPLSCYFISPVIANGAQVVELTYALGFYVVAIVEFREFESKTQRVLWKFFSYFVIYAAAHTVASINRALDEENSDNPQFIVRSMIVHHVLYTVNMLVLVLTMNNMKLKPIKKYSNTSGKSEMSQTMSDK